MSRPYCGRLLPKDFLIYRHLLADPKPCVAKVMPGPFDTLWHPGRPQIAQRLD
jgi:hypothetical protein